MTDWHLPEYDGAPLAGGYFDSEDVPAVEPRIEIVEPGVVVRMGAPTKFTEVVRETIIDRVKHGASVNAASRAAGIAPNTLANWLRDPRSEYVAFASELDQAQAQAFVACEQIVKSTKPLDWLLKGPGRFFIESDARERATPAWSDPTHKIESRNMNLNGNVAIPAVIDTSDLPLEDLEKLEAILMKAQPRAAAARGLPAAADYPDAENVLTAIEHTAHDPDAPHRDESEE